MIQFIHAFVACTLCCGGTYSDDDAKIATVKKQADETVQAVFRGDYATLADFTYPKIVEMMGGREKMIAETEAAMKQMKDAGFQIQSFTIGAPAEFLSEGDNMFVIVPTVLELKFAKGKLLNKGYLLGISNDAGASWKFVDGSGIGTEEKVRLLLPKLPAGLKLPEPQQPEFVPIEK